MTKFLYIVEHFVPFPQSEYGGVWNVIGSDDDECFDLITERDQEFNVKYYGNLRNNIQNSTVLALADELESVIVEEFTT